MKLPLGRIRDSCDPGSFFLRPSSTTQDALMSLFTHILKIFKHRKIFEDAPSFFVVYAWDQKSHPGLPADSSIVHEMIQWFEDAGYSTMYSDSTPPSEKAVIDGQLRLLPIAAYPDSVQNVILCGSKLLGHYMAGRYFKKYASKIIRTYHEARQNETKIPISQILRGVQQQYERTASRKFHHVMTELALLDIRNAYNEKSTVIPYLLNGDPQSCLPKYITIGSDNLRVQRGVDGSKYECFFEILGKLVGSSNRKFDPGPQHLIPSMIEIYKRAATELTDMDRVPEGFLERYQSEANKASDDFSSAQRQNPKGIGVSAVREALDAYHSNIMSIERVFGETLPLRKHHIILAKIFDSTESDTFSDESTYIRLNNIFNDTKLKGGSVGRPKRILIHGRPGVGKTTLCKQIIDEYGRKEVLGTMFSWVLWVPLRKLGLDDSLKSFFRSEYFHGKLHEDLLAEKLYQQVFGEDKEKTLLILDGLDESSGWEERNISELAQFKSIIFTTRSGRGKAGSAVYTIADLELEAMGFSQREALNYIDSHIGIKPLETVNDIWFFATSPPGFDLAQIPICLDILCSSWDDVRLATPSNEIIKLSVLYEVVVARLWRRDILRLGKRDPSTGSVMTKDILDAVRDFSRLHRLIYKEMAFLEALAISLTREGKIDFGHDEITATIRQVERDTMLLPLSLEYDLRNLSFLHSDGCGGYSFIHRTFQEYFAALWISHNGPSLRGYLASHVKYAPAFERIWQFIAGSIQTKEALEEFFDLIESEPRDLLGPAHQWLLLCCFNEVRHSLRLPTCIKVIHRLARWMEFECEISTNSFLKHCGEYPDEVIEIFLSNSTSRCVRRILNSVGGMYLSPMMIELLIKRVNSESLDAHAFALGLLYTQKQRFSLESSQKLILRLAKRDDDTGYSSTSTLHKLSDSSVVIAKSLLYIFKYPHELSQDITVCHLFSLCVFLNKKVDSFLAATLSGCMTLLEDKDEAIPVRIAAADMLQSNCCLSDETVKSLAEMLRDSNKTVRYSVIRAMRCQHSFSVDTIEILTTIMKDDDEDARHAATLVYYSYSTFSGSDIAALVALVWDSNASIQSTAAVALGGLSSIPDDAVAALVSLHNHHNKDIRASTAKALGKYLQRMWLTRSQPSGDVEAALIILLEDPVDFVRMEAVWALGSTNNLSQKTTAVLKSKILGEPNIKKADIMEVFIRQLKPNFTFAELVALLKIIPDDYRSTLYILPFLFHSEEVWRHKTRSLLAQIGIHDPITVTSFGQTGWPDYIHEVVLNLCMKYKSLGEEFWYKFQAPLHCQISLSRANMQGVLRVLQDSSGFGSRILQAEILAQLSTWPNDVVEAVMEYFQDKEHLHDFCYCAATNNRELLNKLLSAAGLLSEAEERDTPERKSVLNPYILKSIYGVLLLRGFNEQLILFIDHEHGECVLYDQGIPRTAWLEETLGTASIEERRQHCSYYTAIREIRERWNPRGLDLWD
ncbi:nacht nucleoside triphosphatase [Metarhizium robertsii ARSEF 23]|nr:nacht nucleoside triphosphatase [Metarhizium robertsii ARSEF 23]EFY96771.2 nacht nucleoside triphosphatase [Metarhizium robertsii ARSEF 23]